MSNNSGIGFQIPTGVRPVQRFDPSISLPSTLKLRRTGRIGTQFSIGSIIWLKLRSYSGIIYERRFCAADLPVENAGVEKVAI
jgi:hypothetical protein